MTAVALALPARAAPTAPRRASAARATLRGVAVRAPAVLGSPRHTRGALVVRGDAIDDAAALADVIQPLRERYQSYANKPVIGDKAARQAGGVSLRVMDVKTVEG